MNDEAFRAAGHALVDWIADYWRDVASLPVASRQTPGALRAALPPRAPEEPEAFSALLADVERLILPGLTHWQSPNFFAFFPANASGPAVLG
ncbi:MAG: aspartate aminotransferase family protein, partial [Myxococcales bacterium]|nr:aspartate aminotransferase family protein [Myxococcales bacterium]